MPTNAESILPPTISTVLAVVGACLTVIGGEFYWPIIFKAGHAALIAAVVLYLIYLLYLLLKPLGAHDEPDTRLLTYLRAFFSDWLTRMSGPLSVPFAAAAVFSPNRLQKVIWASLAVVAAIYGSYRVWRKERLTAYEEIGRLRQLSESREKADLVIHAEDGSRFYVHAPGAKAAPLGLYLPLRLSVENKGRRNSIIRRFDVTVEETSLTYCDVQPSPRQSIPGRSALYAGLPQDWIMGKAGIVIQAHSIASGILPFYVTEAPPEGVRELHCKLTLTDTEGVTASQVFVVPSGES